MSYFLEGTASDGIFSLLGKGDKQNQELPCSEKGITKSYQAKKMLSERVTKLRKGCQQQFRESPKALSNDLYGFMYICWLLKRWLFTFNS